MDSGSHVLLAGAGNFAERLGAPLTRQLAQLHRIAVSHGGSGAQTPPHGDFAMALKRFKFVSASVHPVGPISRSASPAARGSACADVFRYTGRHETQTEATPRGRNALTPGVP